MVDAQVASMKVLVVDDNREIRDLYPQVFQSRAFP